MIKNERQYRITRAQAERFEQALAALTQQAATDDRIHPLLRQAEIDAVRSQLGDLRAELAEFDVLRSGDRPIPAVSGLVDLPRVLIQRRIAAGLTQKELARRLGLREQQIQRYEATGYASASLSRIIEVARALEMTDTAQAG
jgi:DNA-binding XRE family transcriptional regulator